MGGGKTQKEEKKQEVAGPEGRGKGGGGKREKLVHAMIMVVNHKSHKCCKEKVKTAKQNQKLIPSGKKRRKKTHTQEAQNAAVVPNAFQAYKSPQQLHIHLPDMA